MRAKGKKVDTYIHDKFMVSVDIRLDSKTGTFYAEIYDKELSNKDLIQLKGELKDLIESNAVLDWKPIIIVKYIVPTGDSHIESTKVDGALEIKRLYITQRFDGSWSQVEWGINPEDMHYTRGEYTLEHLRLINARPTKYTFENLPQHIVPERSWSHLAPKGRTSVFAYTDELWNGLLQMVAAYHMLNQRVADMLISEDATHRIAAAAQAMLPAPSEKGNSDDTPATET